MVVNKWTHKRGEFGEFGELVFSTREKNTVNAIIMD
jgi:hypothetical protein